MMKGPTSRLIAAGIWTAVWSGAVAGVFIYRSAAAGLTQNTRREIFNQAWAWSELRATANIPLWDPHRMGGVPFAPASAFRPFYPPAWLGLFGGAAPWVYYARWGFHLLLAAALMTGVARAWGFSWAVSGVAGLSWMLTGPLAAGFDPATIPRFEALCYLPLTMHGAFAIAAGMNRPGVIASALGIGLAGLAGIFSTLVIHLYLWFTFLLVGLFIPSLVPAFLRFANDPLAAIDEAPKSNRKTWNSIGLAILALALGLSLAGVIWIPEVEWNSLSNWSSGVDREISFASALSASKAWSWLIPEYAISNASFYIGAGAISFAASTLIGRCPRSVLARAAIVMAIVAWVLAAGGFHSSIHRALHSFIPGYRWILPLSDIGAIAVLCVVVAGAAGLEEFLSPSPRRRAKQREGVTPEMLRASTFRARGSMWMTFGVAAAVWALVSRMKYLEIPYDARGGGLAVSLLGRMHLAEGLMTALGIAGAWAFAASMPDRLKAKREVTFGLLTILIAFIGIDLVRSAYPLLRPVPQAGIIDASNEKWAPIATSRAWDGPRRYELRRFAGKLTGPRVAGDTEPQALKGYSELHARLGPDHPNFSRLFKLGLHPRMLAALQDFDTTKTMHFPNVNPPYLRQSRHKLFVETREELLARIANPEFDALQSTTALVADLPREIPLDGPRSFAHRDAGLIANVNKQESGVVRLDTKSKLEGWFEASEPSIPGWEVSIDGEPPKYAPSQSDGFFLSFHLPPGQHVVELRYQPVSFELGLYLSLLGAACVAFFFGRIAGSEPIFESARQRAARVGLPSLVRDDEVKEKQKVWEI